MEKLNYYNKKINTDRRYVGVPSIYLKFVANMSFTFLDAFCVMEGERVRAHLGSCPKCDK
jgi:hypothetical protein